LLVKESKQDKVMLATAYTNLSAAQKSTGDLKNALTNYGWALVYDRNNANLWHERGQVRAGLGQTLRAAADETLAIRNDPRKVDAWIARGDLYRAMGALTKAEADASEALKLDPKSAVALANRGYARLRMGLTDKAKEDAEEAIKIDAKSVRAYLTRGLSQEKADKAKAVADVKKAFELDPKDKVVQETLKRLEAATPAAQPATGKAERKI
jgi:tetratricopeptide (TPR) repeat protein